MDPLSDAFFSLNVKDVESGQLHIGGCWAIRMLPAGGVDVFESTKGSFWLSVDELAHPILIQEGDCILVANQRGYCKSSEPDMEAAALHSTLARSITLADGSLTGNAVFGHRGDCDNTMGGARLIFEERASFLFDLLPPIIHIRANSNIAPVFRSMLHVLAAENAAQQLGGTIMTNHLVQILLVQALRSYVASEVHPRGWLGALVDAKIGAALALMHRDNTRQWTVEGLAAAVGMSRSSFGLRFKTLVGQAPLDYWLQRRMRRAGHILCNGNRTVSSVAFELGYESEKSFGKTFKRVMGCAPTSYRTVDRTRPIDMKR
jgi:AraC-like DNA-binding protein